MSERRRSIEALAGSGHRFGRNRRIRKSDEFAQVLKAGIRGSGVFVNVALVAVSGPGRIGISAATKVGGSVARNRARRMVREYYRHTCEGAVAYDMVVNVKSGFAELSYNEAAHALEDTISRAIASGKRAGRHPRLRS